MSKPINTHQEFSLEAGIYGDGVNYIVPFIPVSGQDALSGAGAISNSSYYTKWTTTGAEAGTLADGLKHGQLKKIQLIVDGGDGTLTPDNLEGYSTITFADAGDYVVLIWDADKGLWVILETGNDADGATAPALA